MSKELIRPLYESDAKGLLGGRLLEEVGTRLVLRCGSILAAGESAAGRAKFPRCAREGRTTIISRSGEDPGEVSEGKLADVIAFLNDLSAGTGADRRKTHEELRETIESMTSWQHPR